MPGWLDSLAHFNPSRARLAEFLRRAAQETPARSLLLDAGAGEGFYKHLFSHTSYHATDFGKVEKAYGRLHYLSDLTHLPIAAASYDVIVCTQVFEHLPQPGLVLAEFFRILKPGGRLWFSAPFFFPEHEIPFDFYRYTQYGLSFLLARAGFVVSELQWLEGYFGSLGFQLRLAARTITLHPKAYHNLLVGLFFWPVLALMKYGFYALSFVLYFLEMQTRFVGAGYGKNFCGVAVKPSAPDNAGQPAAGSRSPEPAR